MIIGLDVDDTMTNTSELLIEYAEKHFNNSDKNLIRSILNPKMADKEIYDFYCKHLQEIMMKYTLKENCKEVIDRLRLKGHKIIIITASLAIMNVRVADLKEAHLIFQRKM